jgi:twinkle protein
LRIIERHKPCPSCTSSDAYCLWEDGHGYCFSCKQYFRNNKEETIDTTYTYEYISLRGISKETLAFYDCKTKIAPNGEPISIGFRYPNGSYKIRSLTHKDFYTQGEISKAGLFGQDKFATGGHKYVCITEGELDACSIYQTVKVPTVSVKSSVTAYADCQLARSWLNSHERIFLAFDTDEPGREAANRVAKLFDYNKVYLVDFSPRKDANDYLQAGEENELRNIWWNSKKYLPESIISSFSVFEKILKEPHKESVPYPFKTLTEMTYGLRTGESVLITAQEGIGKTELMHAIEFGLLRGTTDAVGAIFLEEPKRRHLQALGGLELRLPVHLPDVGVTDDQVFAATKRAIGKDDRLHLYSHFGSSDPEVLLDCIRFMVSARDVRWVLLDHISMACSGLAGEDERRALDYISTRLEMMVKELDFGLIIVSHVNDEGKTRGSRYIGKIADIRIDCTRDTLSDDPVTRNTLNLTISKNRFSGKTGAAGRLFFDLSTFTFSEIYDAEIQSNSSLSETGDWRVGSNRQNSSLDQISKTSLLETRKMEGQESKVEATEAANDNIEHHSQRLLA